MKPYHPDDPTLLGNWFDPHDTKHIQAYREMEKTGSWPQWYRDRMAADGIVVSRAWQVVLLAKMAEAWLAHKLGDTGDDAE